MTDPEADTRMLDHFIAAGAGPSFVIMERLREHELCLGLGPTIVVG